MLVDILCPPSPFYRAHIPKKSHQPKFNGVSGLPWELGFVQNQVWNRLFMDMVGYHGPTAIMARKILIPLRIKHNLPLNIPFEMLDAAKLKTEKGLQSLQKLF